MRLLALPLAAAVALSACSQDAAECEPACVAPLVCRAGACGPADGDPSDAGTGTDTGPRADSGIRTLVGLAIEPADVTLTSIDGAEVMQPYTITGTWSDGTTGTVQGVSVGVNPVPLARFDTSTLILTANGRYGGPGAIQATAQGLAATATFRVIIDQTIIVPGTAGTAPDLFAPAPIDDPPRATPILYPLDRAVMPQNVAAPEVQWNNGAQGDLFRVRLEKPSVRITAYLTHDGPAFRDGYLFDNDGWRRIAQSEPDLPATLSVARYDAATGQVIGTPSVSISFAKAALLGSIYYWDIAAGRIIRINDGTTNRDAFLPNPPQGCVGCHSVSASGRYMAGRFGGGENVGSVFDLTLDLTGNPPPLLFPDTTYWWFSTFSPDDRRLFVTVDETGAGGAALLDPFTGARITPLEGALPTYKMTHPAWSPDGTAIAYVANHNNWGGENTTGDLFLLPILGEDRIGLPSMLLAGTSVTSGAPGGPAASYPTWSPDSSYIAFAHGSSSRSENGLSALYLVRRDGNNVVRLDNASGGVTTADNYQPRFSPFQQGGYFWMSFLSRRDYGNAKAGTQGTTRQQLWVSAIKESPAPGEDPSEVGYWLPGQDTASQNIAAYWSQRACRETNTTCQVDAECCSGDCTLDTAGNPLCAPMQTECRELGRTCTDSVQCCNGILCIGGTCGNL